VSLLSVSLHFGFGHWSMARQHFHQIVKLTKVPKPKLRCFQKIRRTKGSEILVQYWGSPWHAFKGQSRYAVQFGVEALVDFRVHREKARVDEIQKRVQQFREVQDIDRPAQGKYAPTPLIHGIAEGE
jgi:hypothetical protein